ncbi:hypothetical protein K440DRAFT_665370 [Wilcoxina mikolae CBS 423.85]|nr:hypothetical protein K440DRAFT_665370 [Wilcoxina mikolae CBS 423.85]
MSLMATRLSRSYLHHHRHTASAEMSSDARPPDEIPHLPAKRVPPLGSIYLQPVTALEHPKLICDALHAINASPFLRNSHRNILLTVIPHLRCSPDAVQTIIDLPPKMKMSLADVLFSGLLLARNRGGKKRSGTGCSSRPTADTPVIIEKDIEGHAASLIGSPEQTEDPIRYMAASLGIDHIFGDVASNGDDDCDNDLEPKALARKQKLHRAECLRRQLDRCPLTLQTTSLESAHLVPHTVAGLSSYRNSLFWLFLAVVLGPEQASKMWELVGAEKSWRGTNGIALNSSLHKMFDNGQIALLPLPQEPDPRIMDVEFWWRTDCDISTFSSTVPRLPRNQAVLKTDSDRTLRHAQLRNPRRIEHGDQFRMFTNDPEKDPLPYPALFELHFTIWTMLDATGLGETLGDRHACSGEKRKREDKAEQKRAGKRRMPPKRKHQRLPVSDDSQDSDNDNDGGGAASRTDTLNPATNPDSCRSGSGRTARVSSKEAGNGAGSSTDGAKQATAASSTSTPENPEHRPVTPLRTSYSATRIGGFYVSPEPPAVYKYRQSEVPEQEEEDEDEEETGSWSGLTFLPDAGKQSQWLLNQVLDYHRRCRAYRERVKRCSSEEVDSSGDEIDSISSDEEVDDEAADAALWRKYDGLRFVEYYPNKRMADGGQ